MENKPLTEWHQSVVDSSNWQLVTTFAMAEFASLLPTADELRGAKRMLDLLTAFTDPPKLRGEDPGFNLKSVTEQPQTLKKP